MTTWKDWLVTDWTAVSMTVLSTAIIYAAIVIYTRLAGLRSFSKMSAFDFAMTLAIGSLFASTIVSPDPPVLLSLVAFALLFAGQRAIAVGRRWHPFKRLVDNRPMLLMAGDRMLHENMRAVRVTEDDVRAKLREANVLSYEAVKAVVFETTGDISVLHGPAEATLDPEMLADVVRAGADVAAA